MQFFVADPPSSPVVAADLRISTSCRACDCCRTFANCRFCSSCRVCARCLICNNLRICDGCPIHGNCPIYTCPPAPPVAAADTPASTANAADPPASTVAAVDSPVKPRSPIAHKKKIGSTRLSRGQKRRAESCSDFRHAESNLPSPDNPVSYPVRDNNPNNPFSYPVGVNNSVSFLDRGDNPVSYPVRPNCRISASSRISTSCRVCASCRACDSCRIFANCAFCSSCRVCALCLICKNLRICDSCPIHGNCPIYTCPPAPPVAEADPPAPPVAEADAPAPPVAEADPPVPPVVATDPPVSPVVAVDSPVKPRSPVAPRKIRPTRLSRGPKRRAESCSVFCPEEFNLPPQEHLADVKSCSVVNQRNKRYISGKKRIHPTSVSDATHSDNFGIFHPELCCGVKKIKLDLCVQWNFVTTKGILTILS